MSIGRIGSASTVTRDSGSSGLDQLSKREELEAKKNAKGIPLNAPASSRASHAQASSGASHTPVKNGKVEEVAKLYEKQFLGEMVKAMRGTISFTEKPSMAENIYRDQLDSEYVDSWGNQGGIGMSELIYEQIMQKYFNSDTGQNLKKQGPIAISDKDVVRVARVKSQEAVAIGQVPLRVEVKPAPGSGPTLVQAPWDAKVVSRSRVDGKSAVTLEHDGGLRSTVVFDGVSATDTETGNSIKKGQALGTLNPDTSSFLWNIKEARSIRQDEIAPIRQDNSRRPAGADSRDLPGVGTTPAAEVKLDGGPVR